jgi:hypothetical protein
MKEAVGLFGVVRESATRRARHWGVQFDVGEILSVLGWFVAEKLFQAFLVFGTLAFTVLWFGLEVHL